MKAHRLLFENKYDQLHLYSSKQMLLISQLSILLLSVVSKNINHILLHGNNSFKGSWQYFDIFLQSLSNRGPGIRGS